MTISYTGDIRILSNFTINVDLKVRQLQRGNALRLIIDHMVLTVLLMNCCLNTWPQLVFEGDMTNDVHWMFLYFNFTISYRYTEHRTNSLLPVMGYRYPKDHTIRQIYFDMYFSIYSFYFRVNSPLPTMRQPLRLLPTEGCLQKRRLLGSGVSKCV